jgi:hypothetical protein
MRRAVVFFFSAVAVACHSEKTEPNRVTIAAPTTSSSAPIEAPYVENARTAFDAAEALERAGRTNEAHTAYEEIVRKWAYTMSARQARERLAVLNAHEATTVGDVTCSTDADCAVTTKRDCCECCPRKALATSKKWLQWRDTQQCAVEKCAGCDESCPPETGKRAACNAGKCALVR